MPADEREVRELLDRSDERDAYERRIEAAERAGSTWGVGKNSATRGHFAELGSMGGLVVMVPAKMGACGTPSA